VYPLTADPKAKIGSTTSGGLRTVTRRQVSVPLNSDGSGGFVTIRSQPGGLVIGNAFGSGSNAWTMDQGFDSGGYWGGYIFGGESSYGPFDACGWIHTGNFTTPGTSPSTSCSTASTSNASFSYYWNAHNNCTYDPDTGLQDNCDGTPVSISCDPVPELANIHQSQPADPNDVVRYVSNPGHAYSVNWRYVTNDATWIMARDPHFSSGSSAAWVFIPAYCFTNGIPDGQPISQD
jgi:hypothetical protein